MTQAVSSKEAAAYLIDPMNAPEPASETGPGAHFGSTFDPAHKTNATQSASSHKASSSTASNSNNPFRKTSGSNSPPAKGDVRTTSRSVRRDSPPQAFPTYRAEAFGDYAPAPRSRSGSGNHAPPPSYEHATSNPNSPRHRRRTSSLKERYPGDKSGEPLEIIRKDSKKANRSPHLRKKHQPGPDTIDRLDPAIGGRAYHHEGPYDAALLARNSSFESSPVAALKTSNAEALKATPKENIKDAVERHKPLDGVAVVPPGMPDRFGRTYNYEEGADLMREDSNDGPGYKRWADKDYSPDDLKGQSEPTFSLDKALRRHNINDDGIEMTNGSDLYKNGRDSRDPVQLAGGESRYVDAEIANTKDSETGLGRSGSLRAGLKKRIGSLRHKRADS